MQDINKIIAELKDFENNYIFELKKSYEDGKKDGATIAYEKTLDVLESKCDVKNIDWNSIQIFSVWCYMNGIDFSYMSKATDTIPFTTRVVEKFKMDMMKNEV